MRSVHNVGAVFRTADAIGVSKIYLCGTSPTPLDRFGKSREDLAKAALGAEKNVPWEYVKSPTILIKKLKLQNFQVVSVEQSETSIDYKKVKTGKKVAIIFGNEIKGVSKSIVKMSDTVAEIPMHGKKESLNVSVAAGIVLFRLFDR